MAQYDPIREECLQANLQLAEYRLIDLTFGNVSVADRAAGVFAVKPSGVDYSVLTPADMVIVAFDGSIVERGLRPSSDTPTHRRLLVAFDGVRSVVHTHSRNAVAFAQAGIGIPCLGTTHADYFHGEVPVTRALTAEEIATAYEWETGSVILECFAALDPQAIPAVLVRHHGPFIWGPSGAKAVETALALEVVAEMAIKTLALNPQAATISAVLHDKHFLRKHGPGSYYGQSALRRS